MRCDTIRILGLDIVVEDCKCLVDFLAQFLIVVNPKFVSTCRIKSAYYKITHKDINSGLSISRSIPVILPASSGCRTWILG